ncbi:uncharacterized protein LOC123530598 [Mercenaria mercenaria]|uniref:uncharacterized protein LOC123530598 n=1 Tax=Mercenaria mercenaria TaxID=6596 RepID=UPI00234F7D58|nr:uncharacterized protein LOC123530598 [Mercenaria mercenaria]
MRGILNISIIYVMLFYGLSIFSIVDINALEYKHSLKNTEPVKLANATNGKTHNEYYDPVLSNFSSLFEYLKAVHIQNDGHSRQKRSRSRNCLGQCEHSLCPWREEWDEERTRVPQFIKYAVCENPTCNFAFVGLEFASAFILGMRTHCDLVKIDIQVTEDGLDKWLTDWPIACVCTQRVIDTDVSLQLRHPGRHSDQVDTDITNNVSLEPVSRQRIILEGARHRSLSRAQRRRLRNQRRNMQNTESWEQIMERKYNRT